MPASRWNITNWLERAPASVMNGYAVAAAFGTYFCMYAFRKPFTAGTYEGLHFAGSQVELKTAFVISQLIGYTASKFMGIKVCSEASRGRRAMTLVALIAMAELALVLFAVAPSQWKVAAIFLNGLPLGMVWGLVVRYLEGRRTSDILLPGLACSFIVSSGVVKDVGRALMAGDPFRILGIGLPNPLPPTTEFWMPAATGLVFLPPFVLFVWLLNQVPEPTIDDIAARTERQSMDRGRRHQFLLEYLPGIVLLITAYVFLTAFRDYRDNYMVEILDQLGYPYEEEGNKDIMSNMELSVALGVLATMSLLYLVKNNRHGLFAIFGVIMAGIVTIGVATAMLRGGLINGFWWMALAGLGSYMAYVPYNAMLFDRLMASTRFVGTAVFAMYLADSAGYTGSIALQLGKDLFASQTSRSEFLQGYSWFLSLSGTLMLMGVCLYFWRVTASSRETTFALAASPEPVPEQTV
jgi:hypothetical protein